MPVAYYHAVFTLPAPISDIAYHGFHRIRHYGLFANGARVENLARARQLLAMPVHESEPGADDTTAADETPALPQPCPCCGGPMIIIETFEPSHPWRDHKPRGPPSQHHCA